MTTEANDYGSKDAPYCADCNCSFVQSSAGWWLCPRCATRTVLPETDWDKFFAARDNLRRALLDDLKPIGMPLVKLLDRHHRIFCVLVCACWLFVVATIVIGLIRLVLLQEGM